MPSNASCSNDFSFGPAVLGCRANFDFTQLFERTILWSVPSAIFILVATLRFLHITSKPRVVSALHLQVAKSVAIGLFISLQLALVVVSIRSIHSPVRAWTIAGSVLALVAGAFMLVISFLDHARSARSSALMHGYLLLTILFDAAQARTLWSAKSQSAFAALFSASLALKVVVFALELYSKSRWIDQSTRISLSAEATSNIFSLASYYWLRALLWLGFHKSLALADLYPLNRDISVERAAPKLKSAIDSHSGGLKGNALLLCLFKAFSYEFAIPFIPRVAKIGLRFAQSFLMQSLLTYLGDKDGSEGANKGYGLIGAAALVYGGLAVAFAYKSYFVSRLMSMARAALCALVYRRVTGLGPSATSDAAPLTLMSADIVVIQNGIQQFHELWGSAAEVAIACWLLYVKIGLAFLVPIIFVAGTPLPLGVVLRFLSKRQDEWMSKVETRVGITSSVLTSIKSFKMLGVTQHIGNLVHQFRLDEVRAGNRFRFLQLLTLLLALMPPALVAPITFAFTTNTLTTSETFGALSYIILLTGPLDFLIQSLPEIITAVVSLRRIQDFLAADAVTTCESSPEEPAPMCESHVEKPSPVGDNSESRSTDRSSHALLRIQNGTFAWDVEKPVLKNISLSVGANSLTIITGPVASGKSTLCSALIGQIPVGVENVESSIGGAPIGYCAPHPFLWNGTIRDNIIGYSVFDEYKYKEVLDATMLSVDILSLPLGSDSKVGNNGLSLSGGQRRRVALARVLYADTSLFVLDDVLSGLDSETENQVFEQVLGRNGFIRQRKATAVLCTHALRYLSKADHVIVLNEQGTIADQGPPEALSLSLSDVCDKASSHGGSSTAKLADEQAPDREKPSSAPEAQSEDTVDSSRHMGDKRVYRHYLQSMGGYIVLLMLVFSAMTGFAENFATVWLNYWEADAFSLSRSTYLGIYGGIGAFQLVSVGCAAVLLLLFAVPRAGKTLHRAAIDTVTSAPLDLLNHTDRGTITNLFSQDLSLIDIDLPMSFINFLVLLMTVIGSLAVVAVPAPYLAIAYPFIFAALYALQLGYLRTSRQLRLLDLEAKSPLYNQFLETAEGIVTIRSLGWVDKSIDQNDTLLNESQRPAYLLAMAQNFLTTTLNLIIAILATVATVLATQLKTNSGLTGVSFISLLSLTGMIANMMQNYTELEISLGAVNRLATFSETTPPEPVTGEDIVPDKEWPARGEIQIENVSAVYKSRVSSSSPDAVVDESLLTLRDLSLHIRPGEVIALCGRTGSGKSSLLLLLLRLLDPTPESPAIKIDGVSIQDINREMLRQRLITIPQDPSFLPAGHTIKENLDLLGEATDEECIEALEQTKLSTLLKDGLHAKFTPDTLSHGHQQIFGFARAILRKKIKARAGNASNGIVILDEPNSKVDADTDALMEDLIKKEFANYTVIYISHRLETVLNLCTRVIVLSKGKVVEEGDPKQLANTPGSWFGTLWEEAR